MVKLKTFLASLATHAAWWAGGWVVRIVKWILIISILGAAAPWMLDKTMAGVAQLARKPWPPAQTGQPAPARPSSNRESAR